MTEIWNQEPYKEMRRNMLADKPSRECKKCYEQESYGAFSLRNDSNRNYGHHIAEVDKTLPDGTNPEFKIRYCLLAVLAEKQNSALLLNGS